MKQCADAAQLWMEQLLILALS